MRKEYGIILAVDPSGAFSEGKGTTGWCIMDAEQNKVVKIGNIFAGKDQSKESFWDAHVNIFIDMIWNLRKFF